MTQLTVAPSDRKSQQHSVSLVFGLFVFVVDVVFPLNLPLSKPHYLIQALIPLLGWNYIVAIYHPMLMMVEL